MLDGFKKVGVTLATKKNELLAMASKNGSGNPPKEEDKWQLNKQNGDVLFCSLLLLTSHIYYTQDNWM